MNQKKLQQFVTATVRIPYTQMHVEARWRKGTQVVRTRMTKSIWSHYEQVYNYIWLATRTPRVRLFANRKAW